MRNIKKKFIPNIRTDNLKKKRQLMGCICKSLSNAADLMEGGCFQKTSPPQLDMLNTQILTNWWMIIVWFY